MLDDFVVKIVSQLMVSCWYLSLSLSIIDFLSHIQPFYLIAFRFPLNSFFHHFFSFCPGFTTSLLLQNLDVVAKEYSNFLEMIIVALGARVWFGSPLHFSLLSAIAIVSVSIVLYNRGEAEQTRLEADNNNHNKFKRVPTNETEAGEEGLDDEVDGDLESGGSGGAKSARALTSRRAAEVEAQQAARSYDEFVLRRYEQSESNLQQGVKPTSSSSWFDLIWFDDFILTVLII